MMKYPGVFDNWPEKHVDCCQINPNVNVKAFSCLHVRFWIRFQTGKVHQLQPSYLKLKKI